MRHFFVTHFNWYGIKQVYGTSHLPLHLPGVLFIEPLQTLLPYLFN